MTWHSLFLPSTNPTADPKSEAESIVAALHGAVMALGYSLYDPFAPLPGKAYPQVLRLFVAPPAGGWTRVIAERDPQATAALVSKGRPCVQAEMDDEDMQMRVWIGGAPQTDLVDALARYLRPGQTAADLEHALNAPPTAPAAPAQDTTLPLSVLPDDVQQMARQVSTRQINTLFTKIMRQVGPQMPPTGADAHSARALLKNAAPDWRSPGGQRLQAVMACLTIPTGWEHPAFLPLRDSYQLHRRRQSRPQAPLYPGDAEALSHVPDALAFVPVYAGK